MGVNRIWNCINQTCDALMHNENNLLYKLNLSIICFFWQKPVVIDIRIWDNTGKRIILYFRFYVVFVISMQICITNNIAFKIKFLHKKDLNCRLNKLKLEKKYQNSYSFISIPILQESKHLKITVNQINSKIYSIIHFLDIMVTN